MVKFKKQTKTKTKKKRKYNLIDKVTFKNEIY